MDGGGEGITPASNIPQQCSGRDHRYLNKLRWREQNRERRQGGNSGWKLKWKTGNTILREREQTEARRGIKRQTSIFLRALFLWISGAQHWETVTTGTGWMTSGNVAARGSSHNYDTVGSGLGLEEIWSGWALVTTNQQLYCTVFTVLWHVHDGESRTAWICHQSRCRLQRAHTYTLKWASLRGHNTFAYIVTGHEAKQKH